VGEVGAEGSIPTRTSSPGTTATLPSSAFRRRPTPAVEHFGGQDFVGLFSASEQAAGTRRASGSLYPPHATRFRTGWQATRGTRRLSGGANRLSRFPAQQTHAVLVEAFAVAQGADGQGFVQVLAHAENELAGILLSGRRLGVV